jgi:hypothetical protein
LQVKGSGQFLTLSPYAFKPVPVEQITDTEYGHIGHTENTRILIPIVEYHITCDRLEKWMVDEINPYNTIEHWLEDPVTLGLSWDARGGTVNSDVFMGQQPETLLFDSGWTIEPTCVPDLDNPVRYKATAILRQRRILDSNGVIDIYAYDVSLTDTIYGWNHDYWTNGPLGGFVQFQVLNNLSNLGQAPPVDKVYRPRYPKVKFARIFCATDDAALIQKDYSISPP